ncbi:ABC transporter ATP-binding protein [Actinokineospora sp. UTMC 2448]|uniref:ABC transporter ATP-binding protein n=1 Tax=Actinokineospora sp. UTMC 2448 TaxID=2268449 RepID=UPI002164B458|nr:ABC transporter ATP-binding protein [Actinokineospora sp. UTMC 2448]UVS78166.1 putative ABC transporter ATP-binding protein [Actinokineospora sp. UTMC 2448]
MSALPVASPRATRSWLWARLRERPGEVGAALLVGLAGAGALVVPPYALGVLIDRVSGGGAIAPIAVVILVAAVVGGLASGLTAYLVGRLGGRVLAHAREATVARVLTLPATTIERTGKGDLLSRVSADVATVGKAASDVIPTVLSAFLLGVMSLAGMAALDWRLGLAGLVAVPLYVAALRWYLPKAAPGYAEQRAAVGERSRLMVESMQGVRTVHAYRREAEHLRRIDAASAHSRDISVHVFSYFTRFVTRVNIAEFGGIAAILVAGFLLARAGAVTVGEVSAAALLFLRLVGPVSMLLYTFDEVQSAVASLARLVGVIGLPGQPETASATARPVDAGLELADVRFSYDGGTPVLHGVSLRVEPGERVALVGSTGAGKSTVAAIAAGVLRGRELTGKVLLGGVPMADIPTEALRGQVAIVSQETHVFAGPLAADLRMARPDAADDDIAAALGVVGALEWVRALPDGFATVVGEGGHDLTSAQAQQLALARLVLLDPPVAILDEATAEAGSLGARALEESARAATEGRTTLVVAHRLTQAAGADRVVVLEHGRVVAEGTHADLVAEGGHYARLWQAWEADTAT